MNSPKVIKEGLFSFSYVQYTLECPELKTSTVRKLSDIQWFKDKLMLLYPATYFPPLPKKSVFEAGDKKSTEKKIRTLNRFFESLLQNENIRSAPITKDFITLPQKDFERKMVEYDKIPEPNNIREFTTVDGYVDIRINKKLETQVLQINNDITDKLQNYTNLVNALNGLTNAFETVSDRLKDVSIACKNLGISYHNKINSESIEKSLSKFANITSEWNEGYKHKVNFLKEEVNDFFKYISKELDNFKLLYDEYYEAKKEYDEKNYGLDKNRNNKAKVNDSKKEFLNSKTCYGFLLNRTYDEYFRINSYHSKIIQKKLEEMDENKKILLLDYENLIKLFCLN